MNTCPCCGSTSFHTYIGLKDYFLTQESFEVVECDHCHLLFTMPRPDADHIGDYYKSENYLSHQENKSGFIPRIYELVKSVNLRRKFKYATSGTPAGRLLDIGCGVGDFLLYAKQHGWDVSGVEPSDSARSIAETRIGKSIFTPSSLGTLEDGGFDIITMWHVLEHVDNLQDEVSQLSRLLKPGGRLVVALPNFRSYDARHYKDKWAAWDVPRHLNHFSKDTIVRLFSETDLKMNHVGFLVWDAYYISYLSEKYLGHRLPLFRGVMSGIASNVSAWFSGEHSSMVYCFTKKK